MNQTVSLLLSCMMMLLVLFGCSSSQQPKETIAYFTYYTNGAETDYEAAINNTLMAASAAHDEMEYGYYRLTDQSAKALQSTVDLAKTSGVELIFLTANYQSALLEIHTLFPDVVFVLLDGTIDEETLETAENIVQVTFDSYDMGFVSGYLLAFQEIDRIHYVYLNSERAASYGNGLIQGYDRGLREKGLTGTVHIKAVDGWTQSDILTYITEQTVDGTPVVTYYGMGLAEMMEAISNTTATVLIPTVLEPTTWDSVLFALRCDYDRAVDAMIRAYQEGTILNQRNVVFGLSNQGIYMQDASDRLLTSAVSSYEQLLASWSDDGMAKSIENWSKQKTSSCKVKMD